MQFYFKQSTEADLPFYTECFQNEEFQYMLYGDCPLRLSQLENYIAGNGKDYKFVVFADNKSEKIKVGFVHFYHDVDDRYTFIGGIHPVFFNSGLGASASVASLSFFYDINRRASFVTGIYKHNRRSLRLHLAIGFVITEETKEMYVLSLDKKHFDNDFVRSIKNRINYLQINVE